jgi:hypothetical protein
MNEREWLAAIPSLMMAHITEATPASYRKLRLLAVAWARFLESLPDYANAKHVSHLGDEVVEGRKTLDLLWDQRQRGWGYDGDWSIANLVLAEDDGLDMRIRSAMLFSEDRGQMAGLDVSQRPVVARSLIVCVLGNPFRPATISSGWRTPVVLSLAQAAYDNPILPPGHLDPERLAVLADALEDAGCSNPELLNHLRGPGPHVRGCFALDLLLAKN